MIALLWLLNFAISWFNAVMCGKSWNETKHVGGMPHFLNWCGVTMAASGFTWCFLVIIAGIGATWQVEQADGTMATYLTPEQLVAFCDLGYLLVIGPILGSGTAITIHAWRVAWERRTFGSGAVAAYDTFAMIYNFRGAFYHVPGAFSRLGDFFGSKGSSSSSGDGKGKVLLLVILAAAAGIVLTYVIVSTVAKNTAQNRAFRIQNRLDELKRAEA